MIEQKKKSVFKTYFIYFIAMALFCVIRIMASTGWLSNISNVWSDVVYTGIIQVVVMFLIPFLMYMLFINVPPKSVFKTVNFSKTNFQTILVSVGLGIIIFLMNIVVSSIFSGIIGFTGYRTPLTFETQPTPDWGLTSFFINVLLVAVLPAFCEEFLHRGLLLQGTKHIGFKRAIIISSVLFGLIHFNIGQVSYAIVLGLVLGFASVVSKNLWVPIIMHFVNNFIAVYLDFAEANGWFLGDYNLWLQKLSSMDFWIVCVICFIALSVIVLLLFYFIMVLFRQSILKKVNRAIQKVYSKDKNLTDEPVLIDKGKVIHEMLENNTMINLDYEEMKSPFEVVMPKQKFVYKTNFKDNIFLICSFTLGGLITLFTFVWGFI